MTDREQIACVGIAGASRTKVPRLDVREIRGDGLYIGQSSYTANSTNPTDIEVGAVIATNTADDGRNAVSVIACTGLTIDTVISRKVGGTVAGNLMPGGLDIEPDFGYQTCTDIHVKSVRVTTAGYAGVSIFGKSISGVDATRDWNCTFIQIDDFYVQRTGTSGSGIAGSPFARMSDCRIKGVLKYATTRGVGIDIDFAQRINGEFRVQNVTQGVKVGAVNEVRDFEIDVRASDYDTAGLRTCLVTRGRFTGHIYGAIAASTSFAIQCHDEGRGGITQNNIRYEVDAPYDTVNARAFRNEPTNLVTFSLCEICDCNYTGYASVPVTIDASITKVNVRGLNYAGAIPSTGQWVTGDIVYNDTPAIDASSMIQMGWIRLTTGTGNVAGTDWAYARVSNVSPAV